MNFQWNERLLGVFIGKSGTHFYAGICEFNNVIRLQSGSGIEERICQKNRKGKGLSSFSIFMTESNSDIDSLFGNDSIMNGMKKS